MSFSLKDKVRIIVASAAVIVSGLMIVVSVEKIGSVASRVADTLYSGKIKGDLASLQQYIRFYYGKLLLVNGRLVDRNLVPIDGKNQMVDAIKNELGVLSSIYVLNNGKFLRVVSSFTDDSGNRGEGLSLDLDFPVSQQGQPSKVYTRYENSGSKRYFMGYGPLMDQDGDQIGFLQIGIPAETIDLAISSSRQEAILSLFAIGGAMTLIVIILSLIVIRQNLKPLGELASILKEIAEGRGNLNISLPVRTHDEIGQASSSLNRFISSLKNLVKDVKDTAGMLEHSDMELSEDIGIMAGRLNEIGANIDTAKSAMVRHMREVELASSEADSIARGTAALDQRIVEQRKAISESSSAVEELIASLRSSAENVGRTADRFDELLEASNAGMDSLEKTGTAIRGIVDRSVRLSETNTLIAEIASRTDLLAMNAAIEAAHAGESGRGFSVVADEIRKLAETAREQSQGISVLIAEIVQLIDGVSSSSKESRTGFDRVAALINELEDAEAELTQSTAEQGIGVGKVLASLSEMTEIAGGVGKNSSEILIAATSSKKRMDDLGVVGETLSSMVADIANAAKEIDTMTEKIVKLREANGRGITELRVRTNAFST